MKLFASKAIIFEILLIITLFLNLLFIKIDLANMAPQVITITKEVPVPMEIVVFPTYQYDYTHAIMLGKLMYGEARGIESITEQACVAWTVLNRIDAGFGTFEEVLMAPGQYRGSYEEWCHFPTIDDYGRDLVILAQDILVRWEREKQGEQNVGRVLPQDYLWYYGDGERNWFRNAYRIDYTIWDYSYDSPYES